MNILAIDHIQLAIPKGGEEKARSFYADILGLTELPKPPELAKRGGAWFTCGGVNVHLGVEADFRPAVKAHPAFRVAGLDGIEQRAQQGGYRVVQDEPLPGYKRIFVYDPFGNRIELMEKID
jgi:catechol 2,3-dioxygenase-like lactoylglutathione lyase family enzyme